jgi:predicted dehydrogenase
VASGEDRTAKGEDGLRALMLVDAARKSAQTGQVVRLDR